METTGSAPWKEMERVLHFVDLTLFDIKHVDSDEHQRTTGIKNNIILENLKKAAKTNKIWLRIPLIAGFNDSEEHIKKIALLGMEVGAQKISLLPYHEGGKSKSEQLGRLYQFHEGKIPDDEHVNKLKRIIKNEGLKVTVGN